MWKPKLELSTLVELLSYRAHQQPDRLAYTFLLDGETAKVHLTYKQLEEKAKAIATELQSINANGERALLLYPPGLEYIIGFFGCLYAGVVAVPAYPPRLNRSISRLQAIISDCQPTVALTTSSTISSIKQQLIEAPELQTLHWFATDTINHQLAEKWHQPQLRHDTLAFLQYTSGSTGRPKGVMVSHHNLLHNLAIMHNCLEHSPNSQGVIWLPPYHDMGLIAGILEPFYSGFPVTLMSPMAFLQKPIRWLEAISRYQGTTTGAPNFAYELCVSKITPEQKVNLDLSSWEVACIGAEPIRAETLEQFTATFSQCGFRANVFYPCYGMAEATLFISGGLKASPPVICTVQEADLEHNRVIEVSSNNQRTRKLVSCGQTWFEQKVVIVNPDSLTQCQDNEVGEIWLSGSSVTLGYWNRAEETQNTFKARIADTGNQPFLRTGDLGFLKNGEIFVTGRLKDLIIVDGCNHYPQDIELTVEQSHNSLKTAGAFSIDVAGEERLVVVAEIERHAWNNAEAMIKPIKAAISQNHELQVYSIALLKPGGIPRTSSGKIQRYVCRNSFLAGSLNVVHEWGRQSVSKSVLLPDFLTPVPSERVN
ncbi:fatty acyl-AMP ligase [Nostoc sp. C117]|uniref:fatty acyl-AMP ligase n=1 Tax=Nostoc sp. C117 TaxID=3349875 RepID=UPI00370D150B